MLPQRPPAYEYARIRASHTLRQCAERSFFVVGATSHDPWRCPGRLVGASGAISVSAKIRPRGPVRPLWSHVRLRTNPAPPVSAPSTPFYAPLGFGTLQGPRLRERPGGQINATAEERWERWRALHYAGNPPVSMSTMQRSLPQECRAQWPRASRSTATTWRRSTGATRASSCPKHCTSRSSTATSATRAPGARDARLPRVARVAEARERRAEIAFAGGNLRGQSRVFVRVSRALRRGSIRACIDSP